MSYIDYKKIERTLFITLSKMHKLNCINTEGFHEFIELLISTHENSGEFDCMIITGAGKKAFCAGGDILELSKMNSTEVGELSSLAQRTTTLIKSLPFPVIAAVNGIAFGGGLEIALSCDLIYASENALFGLPEIDLGIIPGFGGCVRLPQYIGLQKTKEMIYTSKKLNASEAKKNNLCIEVYPSKEELILSTLGIAKKISAKSHNAIFEAKKVLNSFHEEFKLLELERGGYKSVFNHKDSKDGISKFLKRKRTLEPQENQG